MNFLEVIGSITSMVIVCLLCLILISFLQYKIKEIKESINSITIKSGATLLDYSKNLDIITNKDIEIKFKKRKIIEATINDKNIHCYAWGINKRAAQSKLERELIDTIVKEYEGTHYDTYIIDNYIDDIDSR